jgi:hypothetical protein
MILTIIFVLVLLIGVSLFIAVLGTALLRRNATYARHAENGGRPAGAGYRGRPGPAYEERARDGYEARAHERMERAAEAPHAPPPEYTPLEPRYFAPPPVRSGGAEGKWFFLTIVLLAVIFFAVFFGVKFYQSSTAMPRLFFCETVDFIGMKPVNASDAFTRGNVTLFLRSRAPLETESVRVEVYRREIEGMVPYGSRELPVKRDWTSFSTKVLFDQIGTYTVMIYGKTGDLIAQKSLYIVPDSYAYKPIWG